MPYIIINIQLYFTGITISLIYNMNRSSIDSLFEVFWVPMHIFPVIVKEAFPHSKIEM